MSARTDEIDRLLPLKPLDFSILITLVEGEEYGYSLAKRIAEQRSGAIRLPPSNLYHVLDRLIAAGLIRTTGTGDAADERRQYFAITPFGRGAAAAEARRLRYVMDTAERLNLLPLREPG
jgi:PadR family transcriptional regulator, regulatory protein PadR